VVDVFDYLFGLPVTSGAVGVLEGRECTPGDVLGKMHHPLESPAVAGCAVTEPGADTAQQNALNCASVKVSEGFIGQAKCLRPFHHTDCVGGPFQIVSDVYAKELEAFHLLYCSPVKVDKGVLRLLSPEVHDQHLYFVDVEGEVIFLPSLHQSPHLHPTGCLIIVSNQACCVICKLDD
jgi:hypothetical protein